jgi:hypothetical protein
MGLVAGIKASLGASACLSMIVLEKQKKPKFSKLILLCLIFMILLHCFAIIISGTRAAIVSSGISLVLFFLMSKRKGVVISIVIVLSVFLYNYLNYLVPQATINRLGMFYDQGIEIRIRLLKAIVHIIIENPLGRITGYEDSVLGMSYSHNAIIQLIAEAGILSIPVLVVICLICLNNALAYHRVVQIRALIILSVNVFVQSLSSGSAYNPLLWFLIFFFAALQFPRKTSYSRELGKSTINPQRGTINKLG